VIHPNKYGSSIIALQIKRSDHPLSNKHNQHHLRSKVSTHPFPNKDIDEKSPHPVIPSLFSSNRTATMWSASASRRGQPQRNDFRINQQQVVMGSRARGLDSANASAIQPREQQQAGMALWGRELNHTVGPLPQASQQNKHQQLNMGAWARGPPDIQRQTHVKDNYSPCQDQSFSSEDKHTIIALLKKLLHETL